MKPNLIVLLALLLPTVATAVGVGQITLAVGAAQILQADGTVMPVGKGRQIRVGDVIETSLGGHVHVRFIDGALVSVRPSSRLSIDDYQFNPEQISSSQVRFRLDSGVVRAISGAAAEGARERFRLNTPWVAIGVRGTDFVVKASDQITAASVNQGAIVMTPFNEACSPTGLGPCGGSGAQLLAADMGENMLAEFKPGLYRPEIKTVTTEVLAHSPLVAHPKKETNEVVGASTAMVNIDNKVQDALAAVPSPRPEPPVLPASLVWGHWAQSIEGENLSVPWTQAREGREVTVGGLGYILYRAPGQPLSIPAGPLAFSLSQGQAAFDPHIGPAAAASIESGQLTIDFAQRQFATALQIQTAKHGVIPFQAAGKVDAQAMFRQTETRQKIAGAIANDGRSAGYLFEQTTQTGVLSGLTLWGR